MKVYWHHPRIFGIQTVRREDEIVRTDKPLIQDIFEQLDLVPMVEPVVADDGQSCLINTAEKLKSTLCMIDGIPWSWRFEELKLVFPFLFVEMSDFRLTCSDNESITLPTLLVKTCGIVKECIELGGKECVVPFSSIEVNKAIHELKTQTLTLASMRVFDFLALDNLIDKRIPEELIEEAIPYAITMESGMECKMTGYRRVGNVIKRKDKEVATFNDEGLVTGVHDRYPTLTRKLITVLRDNGYVFAFAPHDYPIELRFKCQWKARMFYTFETLDTPEFTGTYHNGVTTFISKTPRRERNLVDRQVIMSRIQKSVKSLRYPRVSCLIFFMTTPLRLSKPHFGFVYTIKNNMVTRTKGDKDQCVINTSID